MEEPAEISGITDLDSPQIVEEDETQANDEDAGEKSEKLSKLPLARIRTIIKADPDVAIASQESVFLISKATELFIDRLTKDIYRVTQANKRKTIQRKDFDIVTDTCEELAFLEVYETYIFAREIMEVSFLSSLKENLGDLTTSPLPFLQGDTSTFDAFKTQCKNIYDFSKSRHTSSRPDPIPKLLIDDFDQEQIWGQLELLNKKEAAVCLKAAEILTANEDDITFYDEPEVTDESEMSDEDALSDSAENDQNAVSGDENEESDAAEGFHFEESDEDEELDPAEGEFADRKKVETFERTEVDDDFFSLRRMEKFLEEEDRKFETQQKEPNDDDIDYFEDVLSSADEEDSDREDDDGDEKSTRHLKYSDYFDDPDSLKTTDSSQIASKSGGVTGLANAGKDESRFEKHQKLLAKKIAVLEDKSLTQAEWQMRGEVKANARPENSLLQETLQFDNVARPPVEITEQHTKSIEELVKQRILDEAWDDVRRIYKPEDDPQDYKKRILLDSSRSKLTLGEIYEKEYMEKMQKTGKKDADEKETEEHVAVRREMDDLFRKLDALSNFHFIAPPPEPEIKLITNDPTIEREEVQPSVHAESDVLAPEEVYSKKASEEKSSAEKTSTDKKRERRKKKTRVKAQSKAKLERLKKINPESKKVKQIEAIDQLKKASKLPGSGTRVLQGGKQAKEKMTSQKFFSRLQENKTAVPVKKKRPV